jgi:hypothetical protein
MKVDSTLNLDPATLRQGAKAYEDWHWGVGGQRVLDWNDQDMPPTLIESGRLIRMHVRAPSGLDAKGTHPRRKRDTMIQLSQKASQNSHVAFDPDHPDERLYLLLDPSAAPTMKERFWDENNLPAVPLNQMASYAGGRHGRRQDYPDVAVKPVGVLTAVVYYTNKKGDGQSYYIHQMGELSHTFPILCVDRKGRLWLAGGNYTCPTPGITD